MIPALPATFLLVNTSEPLGCGTIAVVPARGDTVSFDATPDQIFAVAGVHHRLGSEHGVTIYLDRLAVALCPRS
jgi:hypothetical protein